MAGLLPAIYARTQRKPPDQPRVDGGDKPGHDEIGVPRAAPNVHQVAGWRRQPVATRTQQPLECGWPVSSKVSVCGPVPVRKTEQPPNSSRAANVLHVPL